MAANGEKVKVTSHPSVKDAIVAKGWEYSDERVVVDGNVITSRGWVFIRETPAWRAKTNVVVSPQTGYFTSMGADNR